MYIAFLVVLVSILSCMNIYKGFIIVNSSKHFSNSHTYAPNVIIQSF